MKAIEACLLTFLHAPQQLHIPIYQRTYSWLAAECDQLWKDIVRAGRDPEVSSHFIGAVVYLAPGGAVLATEPVERLVIDGQQRITTLTLLLAALRDVLESRRGKGHEIEVSPEQIDQQFLTNQFTTPAKRAKLLLTGKDHATLQLILNRMLLEATPALVLSTNIVHNYRLFYQKIESAIESRGASQEVSAAQLFGGIQKLMLVEVSLEKGVDDPQLIFESLNSTGRDLSQADLIRNFVLMRLSPEEQKQLYLEHWQPMEQAFLHPENGEVRDYYAQWFDWFARDYLTMKSGSGAIPKIGAVYEAFKDYARKAHSGRATRDRPNRTVPNHGVSTHGVPILGVPTHGLPILGVPDLVADLHHFSAFYTRMGLPGRETDPILSERYRDINALEVDVAYPFLMRVLDDYQAGRVDQGSLVRVLNAVESYVFRRSVCGIPTNSLSRTFAILYRDACPEAAAAATGHITEHAVGYAQSIEGALCRLDSHRRFPSDEEFEREITIKNLYQTRTCDYLLRKLENFGTTEKIALPSPQITVEHILPQNENLSPAWRTMLGGNWQRVQERWLHTLGNLTLTGYNSSLSDRPFEEKRDLEVGGAKVGLASGRFHLNQSVLPHTIWNEDAICQRAALLSQRALLVWSRPTSL